MNYNNNLSFIRKGLVDARVTLEKLFAFLSAKQLRKENFNSK